MLSFFAFAGVCQRVARCRCSENIPDDILTEILSQQVRVGIHPAKRLDLLAPYSETIRPIHSQHHGA